MQAFLDSAIEIVLPDGATTTIAINCKSEWTSNGVDSGKITSQYTMAITRPPSTNSGLSALNLMAPFFSVPCTNTEYPVYEKNSDSNKGDVCYSSTSTDYVCPVGCAVTPSAVAPFCMQDDGATTYNACRVPMFSYATSLSTSTTPTFGYDTTNYNVYVENSVDDVMLDVTTAHSSAVVQVNGAALVEYQNKNDGSNATGTLFPLVEGGWANVTIVVTAQDGVTSTQYDLHVFQRPSTDSALSNLLSSHNTLDPVFTSSLLNYKMSMEYAVETVSFTPTTQHSGATVTVQGVTTASGVASATVALPDDTTTYVSIIVTAQDGSTTNTYSIAVRRAASDETGLLALATSAGALTPAFSAATLSYTLTVTNQFDSITFTPVVANSLATMTLNGNSIGSGVACAKQALTEGGSTQFDLVGTAADGVTTKSYTIVVTRAPSTDAHLSNLVISSGALTPPFNNVNQTYSFDDIVSYPNPTVTVTATTAHTLSTMTVNGVTTTSGDESFPISLLDGHNNEVDVIVTAQDGTTVRDYKLHVFRAAASSDSTLSAISLSDGSVMPDFSPTLLTYTTSVPHTVTTLTVTPNASYTVGTKIVITSNADVNSTGTIETTSNTPSQSLSLNNFGSLTTITIGVTAQDGNSTSDYSLLVSHAPTAAPTSTPTSTPTTTPTSPTPAPTPAPIQTSTIEAHMVFTTLQTSDWHGDIKEVYETAYGIYLGLYNTSTSSWDVSCGISSTSTSNVRRTNAGIDVTYSVYVDVVQEPHARARAEGIATDEYLSEITTANTALHAHVPVPTMSQIEIYPPDTETNKEAAAAHAAWNPVADSGVSDNTVFYAVFGVAVVSLTCLFAVCVTSCYDAQLADASATNIELEIASEIGVGGGLDDVSVAYAVPDTQPPVYDAPPPPADDKSGIQSASSMDESFDKTDDGGEYI